MERKSAKQEIVYVGTSRENFATCAFLNNKGKVLYDKTREPKFGDLHVTDIFDTAAAFAYRLIHDLRLINLEHSPIVLEGFSLYGPNYKTREVKRKLAVRSIWVPKVETDLSDFRQRTQEYFEEKDVIRFLEQINSS